MFFISMCSQICFITYKLHWVGSGDVCDSADNESTGQHGNRNWDGANHEKVSPEFPTNLKR